MSLFLAHEMLGQLEPPIQSSLAKTKKAYYEKNMQEAYHQASIFLIPYFSSTSHSSLHSSSSPPNTPSFLPSKEDLRVAWYIYFTSKLALGHTVTWSELKQSKDPSLYPLLLQSPPTDPLSLLNKLAILTPFLPIHLHTSLHEEVATLLEKITIDEALIFLDQASFLPLPFREEWKGKLDLKKNISTHVLSTYLPTSSASNASFPFWFSFLNRFAYFSRCWFSFLTRKQLSIQPYVKSITFAFFLMFLWKSKKLFQKWISLLIQHS